MSRKIYIIIAMVFTVVLSVSTFFIIRNHIDSAKQNEVYDNLAEIVEDEPPKENEGVTFSEDKDYLAEYLELYRQNEDMVGWIKVEDTNINYPVVQSVNEPNFYLKHKFDKTDSAYGCPYVQENCDVQKPSDNIIIYGHHMNDGSMFTGLMKYRNKSFWEGHKMITFDTLTDRHQYEVIAVFKTVVYTNSIMSLRTQKMRQSLMRMLPSARNFLCMIPEYRQSMATSLFLFLLVNIQETMAGLLLSLREWIKPHSLLFFEKGGNRWLI